MLNQYINKRKGKKLKTIDSSQLSRSKKYAKFIQESLTPFVDKFSPILYRRMEKRVAHIMFFYD